jgi:hypothetical protein
MRRRPPFALVLVALVALFGGVLALVGSGGKSPAVHPGTPRSSGPAGYACVSTRAAAVATARSAVKAGVSASVPLVVSQTFTGPAGSASARLSENVVERASLSRPVLVRHGAVASGRACARGSSSAAARGTALTRAYKRALISARAQARSLAAATLRSYIARLGPSTLAAAHAAALANARAAAAAARPALEREALAEAKARAGGG